ncbi:hypothetical protein V6Z11_D09G153200 [Gossypium hirsutum]
MSHQEDDESHRKCAIQNMRTRSPMSPRYCCICIIIKENTTHLQSKAKEQHCFWLHTTNSIINYRTRHKANIQLTNNKWYKAWELQDTLQTNILYADTYRPKQHQITIHTSNNE